MCPGWPLNPRAGLGVTHLRKQSGKSSHIALPGAGAETKLCPGKAGRRYSLPTSPQAKDTLTCCPVLKQFWYSGAVPGIWDSWANSGLILITSLAWQASQNVCRMKQVSWLWSRILKFRDSDRAQQECPESWIGGRPIDRINWVTIFTCVEVHSSYILGLQTTAGRSSNALSPHGIVWASLFASNVEMRGPRGQCESAWNFYGLD